MVTAGDEEEDSAAATEVVSEAADSEEDEEASRAVRRILYTVCILSSCSALEVAPSH